MEHRGRESDGEREAHEEAPSVYLERGHAEQHGGDAEHDHHHQGQGRAAQRAVRDDPSQKGGRHEVGVRRRPSRRDQAEEQEEGQVQDRREEQEHQPSRQSRVT